MIPVDVAGPQLGCRGVAPIGHAERTAHAEPALREVEPVADRAAGAVGGNPAYEGGVDASLQDEVLEQSADLVVGECGYDSRPQPEAATQPACDVVLAAAFPDRELPRVPDPALARVEPEHDFAERDQVEGDTPRPAGSASPLIAPPPRRGSPPPGPSRVTAAKSRCGDQVRRDHPAAADGRHGRQREIRGGVRRADRRRLGSSARRGRGRRAPSARAIAARRLGREELEQIEAMVECRDDLGRGRDAGDDRTPSSLQRSTTRALRPGMTTNRAPASTAEVDLLRPHDRAGADEEASSRAASARIASAAASVRKVTSATGSPPSFRASAVGEGGLEFAQHHDRDDPVAEKCRQIVRSPASHPPSTGRTIPCT